VSLPYANSVPTHTPAPRRRRFSPNAASLRLPEYRRASLMTALAGLLAAGLFVYLIYALIKPEKF
jgi:K+-transporting ATPase KdpF subunit